MSEPRNFDTEYDLANKSGPEFILGGHTFRTKGTVHPSVFLADLRGVANTVATVRGFLVDDDLEVFDNMVKDPNVLIDASQLDRIGGWLIEETAKRPTEASGSSGSGDATTG